MSHGKFLRAAVLSAWSVCGFLADAHAGPAFPWVVPVDPVGTWLRLDPQDLRRAPTSFDLGGHGLVAGDDIVVNEAGAYDCSVGNNCKLETDMLAVFVDIAGNFLLPDPAVPVPAIVSTPSLYSGASTDIPQDFFVHRTGVKVRVPAGAVALLFGPDDSFFKDNGSVGYAAVIGCGADFNPIISEYYSYGVTNYPLPPKCRDLSATRSSQYFTFSQLNTGDYAWALLRRPLIVPSSAGYGLDKMREAFGGPRVVNSAYRNPVHNASIGGAPQSRHMYGDAADLRNASGTLAEDTAMRSAARAAHADYIEPTSGPCKMNCVHADWRLHAGLYHD